MLSSLLVTTVVGFALLYAAGSARSSALIGHRPYNNRQNDAPGAREDHLG